MMKQQPHKIIFIGTPEYSVPTLQTLMHDERFDVVAVVTAPDAKVGRRQVLTPPPVKVVAQKHSIAVLQPEKIKNSIQDIKKFNPDAAVTIAYGQIIPPELLTIPRYGCLNLHASLLPKYRGASPIQQAIRHGDTETGVSLMKMDAGMDTGPVIAVEKITIAKTETGETLHDKLAVLSAEVAKKYIIKYIQGELKPEPQNNALASVVPKITRADGRIDWRKPAQELERLTRAYYPWPGTWMEWRNKILKIITVSADVLPINNQELGTLFVHDNNALALQCGSGALMIETLQLEGKKPMTASEFLRGVTHSPNNLLHKSLNTHAN